MTTEQKLEKALDLLWEIEESPREDFFREVFEISGEHMILTEEGWEPGENKQGLIDEYGENHIWDEVNAPEICTHCGPKCVGGAAHNARAEDGVLHNTTNADDQESTKSSALEDLLKVADHIIRDEWGKWKKSVDSSKQQGENR